RLAEREVTATARDTVGDVPARGSLIVARVPLAEGFDVPELGLRVFTDAEVFGFRKPRHPERRRRRVHIGTFLSDLKPGDHVVHEDHGIARFERFVTREVAGVVREYLELRFAGTDVVALPTEGDMERARPMDRLVVGDVGYGKTEVALRAAFKAVMDGKQVAIVVPTTVLAQQHYETFAERLATFPVRVAMLSRFRSPAEQRAV